MILCHEHKFIFLKTRKTAGTSVECALSAFCGPEDVITPFRRAEDEAMRAGRGPQNWDVRAIPLYRRAGRRIGLFGGQANSGSFYNHIQAADARALIGEDVWKRYFKFAISRNPWDRQVSYYHWRRDETKAPMSFAEFMTKERRARRNNHDIYMIDGALAVDFVCKFETLTTDIAAALVQVGITRDFTLPRAKAIAPPTPRKHYRHYYDDETQAIVADWYAPEIKAVGYEY